MKRFYFRIPEANVFEVIEADTFIEAKGYAFELFGHVFNQIQWINTDDNTNQSTTQQR